MVENKNENLNFLKSEIMEKVYAKDLPGFVENEIEGIINLLNYYKLLNIKDNIDFFLENIEKTKENYRKGLIYFYKKAVSNE